MKQTIEIEVPEGKKAIWKDGKVVFEDIKPKLPKNWKEFCDNNPIKMSEFYISSTGEIANFKAYDFEYADKRPWGETNFLPSKQDAEAHLALMQLHQLRDCYRQGWVPNWYNSLQEKYCIAHYNSYYGVEYSETAPYFLAFQSEEIAEEFMRNFRDLIEKAGDLI
jgi:hypothetical protein